MPSITIRVATQDDINIIANMTRALAKESEHINLPLNKIKKDVRTIVADTKEGRFLVAETEGNVVGFLLITGHEWSQWHNGRIFWLASAYIEPDFRKQRVGKSLYDKAVEMSKKEGAIGLRSYAKLENSLSINVQLKYGMKMTGYIVMENLFPDELT